MNSSKNFLKITGPALSRINSEIISARTVIISPPRQKVFLTLGSSTKILRNRFRTTESIVELKNDYTLFPFISEIFTVTTLQGWVGWEYLP